MQAKLQLVTERCLKYQGTARVNLDQIDIHPKQSKDLDERNVERLCGVFRQEGCRRLEVQNHVLAVVSREHLEIALRNAQITVGSLLTNSPDTFPYL